MVVVSPSEVLSNTGQENMNSTCALGPPARHNLFGGGIVSSMDPWAHHQHHQIKQEPMQVREEDMTSPLSNNPHHQSHQLSPSNTFISNGEISNTNLTNSNSPTTIYYHHPQHHQIHHQNYVMKESEESNNNNNNEDNSNSLGNSGEDNEGNDQEDGQKTIAGGNDDVSQSSSCSTASEDNLSSIRPPSIGSSSYLIDNNSSDDPLRRLQMALQRTGMMGTPPPPSSGGSNIHASGIVQNNNNNNNEKPLQCPICTFSTTSRGNFNAHLQSHEDQRSCSMCEFTAESMDHFKEHMKDVHDVILSGNAMDDGLDEEEPGLAVPKINSQGKVKTFRCKQCDFSAVTKLEFWEHTRGHIKQERRLTCPRCPFVTEYKHHLEYHLRNHFGSKPFKCDKCSYTCVNKSMLNSHLKSHSNIYQYRCSDCTYATKYCHSLKLHLRKYGHTPAMVLNADGTPNPLPIVDVYGTRRGPKQRSSGKMSSNSHEDLQNPGQHSPLANQGLNSIHPLFASPYGIPYYSPLMHPLMYSTTPGKPTLINPESANASDQQDKPMGSPYYIKNNNNNHLSSNMNTGSDNSNEQQYQEGMENDESPKSEEETNSEELTDQVYNNKAPLDLSRSELPTGEDVEDNENKNKIGLNPKQSLAFASRSTERRRKGKAFKLDTLALRLQQRNSSSCEENDDEDSSEPLTKKLHIDIKNEDNPQNLSNNSSNNDTDEDTEDLPLQCVLQEDVDNKNVVDVVRNNEESKLRKSPNTVWPSVQTKKNDVTYNCSYCDITFKDVIMYTMHMGYHGFQDPYTCNMCGQQTSDKVSFFLHIARTSHS